ncbi:hypothetical protein IFM89_023901 [Coptis chinensis]|uniref:Uncharacterized protein n=1 Tax=Coptis chinensis TaxID=261450 RepID=A0A835LWZ7_9MAGN|nr:hypothetical protein IFM89_023901 [Coptis chinensis]
MMVVLYWLMTENMESSQASTSGTGINGSGESPTECVGRSDHLQCSQNTGRNASYVSSIANSLFFCQNADDVCNWIKYMVVPLAGNLGISSRLERTGVLVTRWGVVIKFISGRIPGQGENPYVTASPWRFSNDWELQQYTNLTSTYPLLWIPFFSVTRKILGGGVSTFSSKSFPVKSFYGLLSKANRDDMAVVTFGCKIWRLTPYAVLWVTGKSRNNFVFRNKVGSINRANMEVKAFFRFWAAAWL